MEKEAEIHEITQIERRHSTETLVGIDENKEKESKSKSIWTIRFEDKNTLRRESFHPIRLEDFIVEDDPREWSNRKKILVLLIVSTTAMSGLIAGNIFLPALDVISEEFQADGRLISASVSVFALGQAVFPLVWSGLSELLGRKRVYIISLMIFIGGSVGCYLSPSISIFIGMRVIQSLGSSSALAIGATSLADCWIPAERGSKLGIFYAVPLMAPALGPVIGGVITKASSWRNTFLFVTAYGGVCLILCLCLPETYRKERSLVWQKASARSQIEKRERLQNISVSLDGTVGSVTPIIKSNKLDVVVGITKPNLASRLRNRFSSKPKIVDPDEVKLTIRDANPFPSAYAVVIAPGGNALAIFASALLFALQYTMSFSSSRSFGAPPYEFDPLKIGFVLLSFGGGNMVGSITGGIYSDRVLRAETEKNDDVSEPEMRLKSTFPAMLTLVPAIVAYAWLLDYGIDIGAIVTCLFIMGFSSVFIYSSTLAYLVDSNPGLVSAAMATNTLFRGILATVGTQVANPVVKAIGEGWFWTGFACLVFFSNLMILLAYRRGEVWRKGESLDSRRRSSVESKLDYSEDTRHMRRMSIVSSGIA